LQTLPRNSNLLPLSVLLSSRKFTIQSDVHGALRLLLYLSARPFRVDCFLWHGRPTLTKRLLHVGRPESRLTALKAIPTVPLESRRRAVQPACICAPCECWAIARVTARPVLMCRRFGSPIADSHAAPTKRGESQRRNSRDLPLEFPSKWQHELPGCTRGRMNRNSEAKY
jgi:hypothetical protein